MDKPERVPILIFLTVCLAVFFVLYLLLGGENTAIGVEIETSDELILEDYSTDEDDRPIYNRRRATRSAAPVATSFPFESSSPEEDLFEKPKHKPKEWPDWIKRHVRKSKGRSLEQRQAKLRNRLKARGFENQKYLNIRALDLDRKSFSSARNKAQELVLSGQVEEALEVLQTEFDETQAENLLVRSEIIALQYQIAMQNGYASLAEDYLHTQMRLSREINEIKKNTNLVNNPNAKAMMDNTDKLLQVYDRSKESFPLIFESLKQNNGFLPGMKDVIRKAMVGAMYNNSSISPDEMRSNFKQFEKQIEEGWANPK